MLVDGSRTPELSATVSGIMLAHSIISPEQHAAALYFRRWRATVFGEPLRNASPGPVPTDEALAERERRYDRAVRKLSDAELMAVTGLALEHRPAWLRRGVAPRAAYSRVAAVLKLSPPSRGQRRTQD